MTFRHVFIALTALMCSITGNVFAGHHEKNEMVMADPTNVWTVGRITFKDGKQMEFRQGLAEFMQSDLGKKFPGTITYNWSLSDGSHPATHDMVMTFPNVSAWAKWNMAFFTAGTPEAQKWGSIFLDSVEQSTTYTMTTVAAWGPSELYALTEVIPFRTGDLPKFVEEFNMFMTTNTAKEFKGRVAIHQCSYCGEQEANALFSVQHKTPEDFDAWRIQYATSSDFRDWLRKAQTMATFVGNSLVANLDAYPVNSAELLR